MEFDYLDGFKLKKYIAKKFITIFDTRTNERLKIRSLTENNSAAVQIVTIADRANPDKNQKLLSLLNKGYKNNNKAETTI
jgi:hypothetical protein